MYCVECAKKVLREREVVDLVKVTLDAEATCEGCKNTLSAGSTAYEVKLPTEGT